MRIMGLIAGSRKTKYILRSGKIRGENEGITSITRPWEEVFENASFGLYERLDNRRGFTMQELFFLIPVSG